MSVVVVHGVFSIFCNEPRSGSQNFKSVLDRLPNPQGWTFFCGATLMERVPLNLHAVMISLRLERVSRALVYF